MVNSVDGVEVYIMEINKLLHPLPEKSHRASNESEALKFARIQVYSDTKTAPRYFYIAIHHILYMRIRAFH